MFCQGDVICVSGAYQGEACIISYSGGKAKEAEIMNTKLILLFLLVAGLLVACSPSNAPEQIAAYPQEAPIAVAPRRAETTVIYNATLDFEVSNVERSVERAKEIAFEQHGYLVSAQSWYRDGEKHSTVVLAVPAAQFDATRDQLLRMGDLMGEWVSSELSTTASDHWDSYSEITVYLHPRASILPALSLPEWRPVRTFEKAWDVFVTIFGFLLDMVIWVAVVVGPFVVMGWGIKKLIERGIKKTSKPAPREE